MKHYLTAIVEAPTQALIDAMIDQLCRSACDVANSAEEGCHIHISDASPIVAARIEQKAQEPPRPDAKVGHFATTSEDREHWADFTYRTRSGSLGHLSLSVTATTQEVARELAEFEYRKKHRGEITDVKITTRPRGAKVGG